MKKIKSFNIFINESKKFSYNDVLNKQKIGEPLYDMLFSNEKDEFIEDEIDIEELRNINGIYNDENGEPKQTVSDFEEQDMDEDYYASKILMDKIVNGIELSPIVVDENYKLLDGRHRLAAYSELWFYYGYDFPMDSKLKLYKRIKN